MESQFGSNFSEISKMDPYQIGNACAKLNRICHELLQEKHPRKRQLQDGAIFIFIVAGRV